MTIEVTATPHFKSSPPFVPHTKLLDKSVVRVKTPENKRQETMLTLKYNWNTILFLCRILYWSQNKIYLCDPFIYLLCILCDHESLKFSTKAIYYLKYCFLFTDEEKDYPTIVEVEYPQLPIAAEKGKYYYYGVLWTIAAMKK